MGMFSGMSKNCGGLRVSFLKSESMQAKNFQKVRQKYVFRTTHVESFKLIPSLNHI